MEHNTQIQIPSVKLGSQGLEVTYNYFNLDFNFHLGFGLFYFLTCILVIYGKEKKY